MNTFAQIELTEQQVMEAMRQYITKHVDAGIDYNKFHTFKIYFTTDCRDNANTIGATVHLTSND